MAQRNLQKTSETIIRKTIHDIRRKLNEINYSSLNTFQKLTSTKIHQFLSHTLQRTFYENADRPQWFSKTSVQKETVFALQKNKNQTLPTTPHILHNFSEVTFSIKKSEQPKQQTKHHFFSSRPKATRQSYIIS